MRSRRGGAVKLDCVARNHPTSHEITAKRTYPARGFEILVARLTARNINRIFSLCHYFAIMKPVAENESRHLGQNEMAGLKGKSGPPGNMNAFKHGPPGEYYSLSLIHRFFASLWNG